MSDNIEDIHSSLILPLSDMKQYLRVVTNDEDRLIKNFIKTAIAIAEGYLGHSLYQRIHHYTFNKIERVLDLPHRGNITVLNVKDENGNDAAGWFLGDKGITFNYGLNAKNVTVTYVEGFRNLKDIPPPVRSALMAHVATLYDDRYGAGLAPTTVIAIYQKYRAID